MNRLLARQAKLLDFGLAKSLAPAAAGGGASLLPTTPRDVTMPGVLNWFEELKQRIAAK